MCELAHSCTSTSVPTGSGLDTRAQSNANSQPPSDYKGRLVGKEHLYLFIMIRAHSCGESDENPSLPPARDESLYALQLISGTNFMSQLFKYLTVFIVDPNREPSFLLIILQL